MKKYLIIILILILVPAGYWLISPLFTERKVDEKIEDITSETSGLPYQAGLPAEVEAKRQAIYKAALSRDYEKLAAEASSNFHYSFGGEFEGGFVGYLKLAEKDERETAFDIIPTLLKLPYAVKNNIYSWPYVYTLEPSKWTEKDIALMKTFLTDKQIEDFRQFGGYIYYRLGINSAGEWIFYLAGD